MQTQLIVNKEFTCGGIAFGIGDVVTEEQLATWPDRSGTLARRLQNGFVVWEPTEDAAGEADDSTEADPEGDRAKELHKMKADEVREIYDALKSDTEYSNKDAAIEAILAAEFPG